MPEILWLLISLILKLCLASTALSNSGLAFARMWLETRLETVIIISFSPYSLQLLASLTANLYEI